MHSDAPKGQDTGTALGRLARRSGRAGGMGGALLTVALIAVVASACSSGGSSVNTATAPAAIKASYGTFFNMSKKDIPAMVAVIQDGAALKAAVTTAANSSLSESAQGSSISKTTIESSADCTKAMVPVAVRQGHLQHLGTGRFCPARRRDRLRRLRQQQVAGVQAHGVQPARALLRGDRQDG